MDSYFNKPVYEGKYEPIFRFAEFGDVSNYWIALNYYINRDVYQTEKHDRGTELDFDLKNIDGEKIFGDIPESHLETLESRNYVLGGQSSEPVNPEGDLLKVRETYVYAPNKTYEIRNSDIVPIWGLHATDYATTVPVVKGGNVYKTNFYGHTIIHVADGSKFQTGDTVMLEGTGMFGIKRTGYIYYKTVPLESGKFQIIRNVSNHIELDSMVIIYRDPDFYVSPDWSTCNIRDDASFFNCLNGGTLPSSYDLTIRPLSMYVRKAYSTRANDKRRMPTKELIRFSIEEPDLSKKGIFIPQLESGETRTIISRETIPNDKTWLNKVKKGEWYNYEQPEVKFDVENGIYELRERKTQCI